LSRVGILLTQLHPALRTKFFLNGSRTEIMECYWCLKENSIREILKIQKFNPELRPFLKVVCSRWNGGEYFSFIKAGKSLIFVLLAFHYESEGIVYLTRTKKFKIFFCSF
jgi:hypothetical protein